MHVLWYGFDIISLTQTGIIALDRKTRKILVKACFHHVKSDIHRLYLLRREGGGWIIGLFDCFRKEFSVFAEYLYCLIEDYLVAVVKEEESRAQHAIISLLEEAKKGTTASINTKHQQGLRETRMHGQLWRQQEESTHFYQRRSVDCMHIEHTRYKTDICLCIVQ